MRPGPKKPALAGSRLIIKNHTDSKGDMVSWPLPLSLSLELASNCVR